MVARGIVHVVVVFKSEGGVEDSIGDDLGRSVAIALGVGTPSHDSLLCDGVPAALDDPTQSIVFDSLGYVRRRSGRVFRPDVIQGSVTDRHSDSDHAAEIRS